MRTVLAIVLFAFYAAVATAAPPAPSAVPTAANVAYGSDPLQKMDVYAPAHVRNAPVIFMVHGGGWQRGDKTANDVVTNKVAYFLPKGYVFISTNYRLSPQVTPPQEASDVAAALAFAQKNAARWGGDATRFIVMGHSAGGNLVTLVDSVASYARIAGARAILGTVVLDSGAYDVPAVMSRSDIPSQYAEVLGTNVALEQQTSPTLQINERPAPMLLVCDSNRVHDCDDTNAFAAKAHGQAQVYPLSARHGDINLDVGLSNPETARIVTFMYTLKPGN